ncbi:cation transporter [Aliidiomarina sedimenti]|uniref:Cation transporter n=1 Tax=Aliidiomarina sedimenti TaxID=1933879 RepID=A0ABY0BZ62_9GAMM|nr:Na+/H+ antiporter subunit E [Aliidiomarina sedimenti]RUO29967.1 cation transporter [Aliidiomarina sedimenti]
MHFFVSVLLTGSLWWILTEGAQAWWIGGPAVLLASYVATRLHHPDSQRINWLQVPLFALFFLAQSLKAGVDVAVRTLRIRPAINPGTLYYRTSLPPGTARYLFGSIVGLFPGTLCTDFDHDQVILHVLDTNADIAMDCRRLERRIARLFSLPPAAIPPTSLNKEAQS